MCVENCRIFCRKRKRKNFSLNVSDKKAQKEEIFLLLQFVKVFSG
jgi:hypothetical protein